MSRSIHPLATVAQAIREEQIEGTTNAALEVAAVIAERGAKTCTTVSGAWFKINNHHPSHVVCREGLQIAQAIRARKTGPSEDLIRQDERRKTLECVVAVLQGRAQKHEKIADDLIATDIEASRIHASYKHEAYMASLEIDFLAKDSPANG